MESELARGATARCRAHPEGLVPFTEPSSLATLELRDEPRAVLQAFLEEQQILSGDIKRKVRTSLEDPHAEEGWKWLTRRAVGLLKQLTSECPKGQEGLVKALIRDLVLVNVTDLLHIDPVHPRDTLHRWLDAIPSHTAPSGSGLAKLFVSGFERLELRDLEAIFRFAEARTGLDIKTGEFQSLPLHFGSGFTARSPSIRGVEVSPHTASLLSPHGSQVEQHLLRAYQEQQLSFLSERERREKKWGDRECGARFIDALALGLEAIGAKGVMVEIEGPVLESTWVVRYRDFVGSMNG